MCRRHSWTAAFLATCATHCFNLLCVFDLLFFLLFFLDRWRSTLFQIFFLSYRGSSSSTTKRTIKKKKLNPQRPSSWQQTHQKWSINKQMEKMTILFPESQRTSERKVKVSGYYGCGCFYGEGGWGWGWGEQTHCVRRDLVENWHSDVRRDFAEQLNWSLHGDHVESLNWGTYLATLPLRNCEVRGSVTSLSGLFLTVSGLA